MANAGGGRQPGARERRKKVGEKGRWKGVGVVVPELANESRDD